MRLSRKQSNIFGEGKTNTETHRSQGKRSDANKHMNTQTTGENGLTRGVINTWFGRMIIEAIRLPGEKQKTNTQVTGKNDLKEKENYSSASTPSNKGTMLSNTLVLKNSFFFFFRWK